MPPPKPIPPVFDRHPVSAIPPRTPPSQKLARMEVAATLTQEVDIFETEWVQKKTDLDQQRAALVLTEEEQALLQEAEAGEGEQLDGWPEYQAGLWGLSGECWWA